MHRLHQLPYELLLALALAFIHGLIHVFIMPPWQHYDEPSHLEYAWLIANRGGLPQPNDVDHDMRITFARSMILHNFYRGVGTPPDVDSPDAPTPYIGYTQLNDPPLYYLLIAGPMFLLRNQSIEAQLYAARLVSLMLFLVTVVCAWGVANTITPTQHPLRWMLPCSLALLPAFTNLMASVNNDVGAVACFSLFVWGSVRLLKRTTLFNVGWVLIAAAVCTFVKGAAALAIPLAGVVLLFALLRGRWRWLAWVSITVASVVIIVAPFGLGDPRWWYRNAEQDVPLRCEGTECGSILPAGRHAFRFNLATMRSAPALLQLIAPQDLAQIRGKTVTLGAWMWTIGGEPIRVQTPSLNISIEDQLWTPITAVSMVTATSEPAFHAITATMPITLIQGWIEIAPVPNGVQALSNTSTSVYYDGLILVEGDRLTQQPPQFETEDMPIRRGDQLLTNHVRNPSAEQGWIWMRPWAQHLATRMFPEGLRYNFLLSPLDPTGASWYYDLAFKATFETFWARFGWGNVSVLVVWFSVLRVFSVISLLTTIVTWPAWGRWLTADLALFVALAISGVWTFTVLRGVYWLGSVYAPYIPVARYAYLAIIPTLLLLILGWSVLAYKLSKSEAGAWVARLVPAVMMLALIATSIISIHSFYYL